MGRKVSYRNRHGTASWDLALCQRVQLVRTKPYVLSPALHAEKETVMKKKSKALGVMSS